LINKRCCKRNFKDADIVELDQSDIEAQLLLQSNKVLEPLGVHLNFITLTFDLDEQTRQAIDVSTAMKIYKSKNLEDIGKQIMCERAGASKIVIENKPSDDIKQQ
jgi:transposase